MKRQSKGAAFELSICGDELEHDRIQLEHNLQNTELSFRLSSTSDDEANEGYKSSRQHRHRRQDSSIEYPRHISEPSLPEFPSFAHRSRDHLGDEDQSHAHGWSYRTADDDEGINPYGGHSVSTAAHHASALTLSAGLGGGRAARRDPSLSGAEYDPDRPLHAMIAGVNSKQHSMFDLDHTKTPAAGLTYDPLIVDSTAELDRILESGHAPPPLVHSRSGRPLSPISSSSPSTSDSENRQQQGQPCSRPKLSDHLRHVSFSPKRPRSVQSSSSGSPLNRPEYNQSMNQPTPRASRRANIFAASPAQPEVRLHPATPSTGGSKFTRMARGINKELEATQQQLAHSKQPAPINRPSSTPIERNPFHDAAPVPKPASVRNPTPRRSSMKRDTTNGKIHLPDVTGLTAAVDSPMKPGVEYYPFKADIRPRDSEVRLLQTLTAVQGQLQDLEEENGISRRRVRELEMELEECKREVARERTRLFEREEINVRHHANSSYRGTSKGKGKAKDSGPEIDDERLHARYKDAVDEKKALETLINSLRSHLTRLTSELASHQELLTELRKLRDSDAQALREKSTEILQLREEVQRLAGEVEVLRGVVEEGLKERRASREIITVEHSAADIAMSQDLDDEESEDDEPQNDEDEEDDEEDGDYVPSSDADDEPEPFDPDSLRHLSSPINRAAERTMRTDYATVGSTNLGESPHGSGGRLVNDNELSQIAAELEERRSNRSSGSIRMQRSASPARINMRATVEDESDNERCQAPQQQQARQPSSSYTRASQQQQGEPSTSRPSAPTPGHATRQYGTSYARRTSPSPELETPFPQIRGEQLERLFFSAPEHNARTCTVCYRRGRGNEPTTRARAARAHHRNEQGSDADEGYEGSEDADGEQPRRGGASPRQAEQFSVVFSTDPAHWLAVGRTQGLPAQTVVARVIRELEDDFTHYKSIYVELADQYKVMDAASDVARRNTLAKHLREVVDILEQKGDQIASLYDLLRFKDKSLSTDSIVPEKAPHAASSWGRSTAKR